MCLKFFHSFTKESKKYLQLITTLGSKNNLKRVFFSYKSLIKDVKYVFPLTKVTILKRCYFKKSCKKYIKKNNN